MPNKERPTDGERLLGEHWRSICIEQDEWATPSDLMRTLRDAGIRVIGPAEAAVLDASAAVSQRWLEQYVRILVPGQADADAYRWCEAELARRQQPPEKERE